MYILAGIGGQAQSAATRNTVVASFMLYQVFYNVSMQAYLCGLMLSLGWWCFDPIPHRRRNPQRCGARKDSVSGNSVECHLGICHQLCHSVHDGQYPFRRGLGVWQCFWSGSAVYILLSPGDQGEYLQGSTKLTLQGRTLEELDLVFSRGYNPFQRASHDNTGEVKE